MEAVRHRRRHQDGAGGREVRVVDSQIMSPPPCSITRIWNRLRWRWAWIVQSWIDERDEMVST